MARFLWVRATLLCVEMILFSSSFACDQPGVDWKKNVQSLIPKCMKHYDTFSAVAKQGSHPAEFLMAVSMCESACDPAAIAALQSKTGEHAQGMMQMLPSTFADTGISGSLFDPKTAITSSDKYFSMLATDMGYWWYDQRLVAYRHGPGDAKKLVGQEHEDPYTKNILYAFVEIWKYRKHTAKTLPR